MGAGGSRGRRWWRVWCRRGMGVIVIVLCGLWADSWFEQVYARANTVGIGTDGTEVSLRQRVVDSQRGRVVVSYVRAEDLGPGRMPEGLRVGAGRTGLDKEDSFYRKGSWAAKAGFDWGYVGRRTPGAGGGYVYTEVSGSVPYWFLVTAASGAAWALGRAERVRRRRARRGLCLACGYDLRGSGDKCPECGRPTAAVGDARSESR